MTFDDFCKKHNCNYEEMEGLVTILLALRLRKNVKLLEVLVNARSGGVNENN